MENLLKKETKCLLVQSRFSPLSFWNYVEVCQILEAKYPAAPLGLMTVAALLPQHWKFRLVDANVEPLLDEYFEWADIVCTGGMLPQQLGVLSIIEKAHQYGCSVVVGGPDPSSQPELYQSADYLVLGEGEVTIPMFIQDLEKGCESGIYTSTDTADMDEALVPRFDLIQFKDYIQVGIQYSRGCPFTCEFCDIIELYGRVPRAKSSAQLIRELQTLYDLGYRGHIDIVDDNFIGSNKNVKRTLADVKEWSRDNGYPFYFSTEASINIIDDDDLLQLMKDVDFRYIFIGIETPEDNILKSTQKKQNMNKPISEAVRKILSYGIIVNGGFIIGFDTENDRTSKAMIKCIQDSGICMAMLGTLYALPNTQLTCRLKREGRLSDESSTLRNTRTEIDQMTSGLNFITKRPRLEILRDFIHILDNIYNPKHYFERVTFTALHLEPYYKYKPGITKKLKIGKAFLKLCNKLGFNRITGWYYWRMFFTVLIKNPKAIEPAVNLAAMFIHFQKQSRYIIDVTNEEIENVERFGEENYNQEVLKIRNDTKQYERASMALID